MEHLSLIAHEPSGPSIWIVAPLAITVVMAVMIWLWWIDHKAAKNAPPQSFDVPYRTVERRYPVFPITTSLTDVGFVNQDVHEQPTVVVPAAVGVSTTEAPVVQERSTGLFIGYTVSDVPSEIYVPLGHALIARRTGGGKSNILALLVLGLLEQGVEVWYANAKYMPKSYNKKTGKLELDIAPMVERCHRTAVNAMDLSKGCLDLLLDAQKLVHKRIETSQGPNAPDGDFPPVVIIFDELKAAQGDWRKLERAGFEGAKAMAGEAIDTLLTKGRQPQVFFITTGQDAQVQSLGASQGTMTNFMNRVAHPSLDNASLVNLMPKGIRRDELPPISSSFQWYVTSEGDMGSDRIDIVDVPLVTQTWLTERLKSVPVRQQAVASSPETPPDKGDDPDSATNDESGGDDEMRPDTNNNEKLALVVAWLRREPNITPAEVARRLWLKAAERPQGQGVGSYGVKAKKLLDDAQVVLQRSTSAKPVTGTSDDDAQPGDELRLSDEANDS